MMTPQLGSAGPVLLTIVLAALGNCCLGETAVNESNVTRAAMVRRDLHLVPSCGSQSLSPGRDIRCDVNLLDSDVVSTSPQPSQLLVETPAELLKYGTPVNRFRCGACVCVNASRKATLADCNFRHTRWSLHRVPNWLPPTSQSIDFSNNRIKQLMSQNLTLYPNLLALNMSNNLLSSIDSASMEMPNFWSPVKILDISFNEVENITDYAFENLSNLTHLFAARIQVSRITNFTFAGLHSLEVLDLSYGIIGHIETGAFRSLERLSILLLTHNIRLSSYKMTSDLFRPLRQLFKLDIAGSSGGQNVPSQSLSVLHNLSELYVDGNKILHFGPEVRNLSKLYTVYVGKNGFCNLVAITPDMFENLIYLKKFAVIDCKLSSIDTMALRSLKHLEEFVLSKPSDITIRQALNLIPYLNNSTLKSLFFDNFHELGGYRMPAIGYNESRLFQGLTKLEVLRMETLHLFFIEPRFVENLPQSLRYLSFKGNRLHSVNILRSLLDSGKLRGLVEFDISDQNYFVSSDPRLREIHKQNTTQTLSPYDPILNPLKIWHLAQRPSHMSSHPESRLMHMGLPLRPRATTNKSPRSLPIYRANNAFKFGDPILRLKSLHVEQVYFSNGYLNSWGTLQLPSTSVVADLSDNKCDEISMRFLPAQNQMEVLSAQRNYLGNALARDYVGNTFVRAYRVTYLDLSHNSIYRLPYKVFQNMSKIRVIVLTDNHLQALDIKLSHMASLSFLDLRRNSVSWISKRSRDDLDTLAMSHTVTLALENNPLPCTCNGLEVLSWIAFTRVRILDQDFLQCRDKDQRIFPMGDIKTRFRVLRRSCVSYAYIVSVSASSVGVALVIITSALLVRNRWRLCYWKNIILARYYGMRQPGENNVNYKFDAYLVYSEDIERFIVTECFRELEDRGHKVCIEAKDFLPGSFIPCNIVSAVQSSTFTVLILSAGYRDNEWFEYSLQMALMEEATSRRQVLHLFLYDPMQDAQLSRDLLRLMRQDAYSEFPPPDSQPEVKKVFWDTFSRFIGHTDNPELFPRLELEV
ncbi:toll-like receptor 4 [Aplysia californica]|uniref:Toll-like receptor 4 n=1 Tax=Aplysia californica TaxID=6500 RepID=A0ABM0K4R3_APLCA|nr:toll-like receptor 4 [Aplysia californica]XP_005108717.1 toll-like receptor 4 [Aplysia californica]XP_005108718.1 toll-like receptor 4 [Aplysia californica]